MAIAAATGRMWRLSAIAEMVGWKRSVADWLDDTPTDWLVVPKKLS